MTNDKAEEIILRYRDMMYRIAFQYFKNPYDADDITQIVSLKLLKQTREFESEEHIRNWMIRVTINECRRTLKAPYFTRHVPLEDYAETLAFETPEESGLFLEVMRLPARYRIVIYLFYYEGFPVREIAEFLNISESAVTSRLQRARNKMKRTMEVCADDRV